MAPRIEHKKATHHPSFLASTYREGSFDARAHSGTAWLQSTRRLHCCCRRCKPYGAFQLTKDTFLATSEWPKLADI
jgi:hypothetical protein